MVIIWLIAALILGFSIGHYRHIVRDDDFHDKDVRPGHNSFKKIKIEPKEITIDYMDSAGKETERPIRMLDIGQTKSGKLTIMAFCFLRENVRMFRIDRIMRVIDDKGIVHDGHSYFDNILTGNRKH